MPRNWNIEHSRRANVNGVELEYQVVGSGEPVLLIHGALLADCLIAPFQLHPIIMEKYSLISYHRCGYGGSAWPEGSISIEQQAEQCRLLLQQIGIDKAHIVGYSYGGLIALQLALSNPEVVHSLVLMEPFLPRTDSKALEYGQQALESFLRLYEAGEKAGALKNFLVAMAGPDILAASDMTLPLNAWEEGEAAVDAFCKLDLPAFQTWGFSTQNPEKYNKPTMPVLSAMGIFSEAICPGFREGNAFLMSWLPQAERLGIRATHGLQIMNPRDVVEGLMSFFGSHPM